MEHETEPYLVFVLVKTIPSVSNESIKILGASMEKVLIVDDDFMIADWLEEVLVDAGYAVCGIAGSVATAIEVGERLRPDLAIIDMRLQDGGRGTQVAEALHRHGVGVIYATGNADGLTLNDRYGQGCLAKPYSGASAVAALHIVADLMAKRPVSCALPREFRMTDVAA